MSHLYSKVVNSPELAAASGITSNGTTSFVEPKTFLNKNSFDLKRDISLLNSFTVQILLLLTFTCE